MVEKPEAPRLLRMREARVENAVVLINDENYQAFLKENPLAVLVLAKTWCSYCQAYSSTITKLAKELPQVKFGIAWLDNLPRGAQVGKLDDDPAVPGTLLFREGLAIARFYGNWPFEDVKEYLEKYLIQGLPIPKEELLETVKYSPLTLFERFKGLRGLFGRKDEWRD